MKVVRTVSLGRRATGPQVSSLLRRAAEALETPVEAISASAHEALALQGQWALGGQVDAELANRLQSILRESQRCRSLVASLVQFFEPLATLERRDVQRTLKPHRLSGEFRGATS
jgi:hypothetical protein